MSRWWGAPATATRNLHCKVENLFPFSQMFSHKKRQTFVVYDYFVVWAWKFVGFLPISGGDSWIITNKWHPSFSSHRASLRNVPCFLGNVRCFWENVRCFLRNVRYFFCRLCRVAHQSEMDLWHLRRAIVLVTVAVEKCEFHRSLFFSRVRAYTYSQVLCVFCCHFCHKGGVIRCVIKS